MNTSKETNITSTFDESHEESHEKELKIQLPVDEFRSMPIPGTSGKVGDAFVRVVDLPKQLDGFMEVNPRVPNRSDKGVLTGFVPRDISRTLRDNPQNMALKNRGIYLLVNSAGMTRAPGGRGVLELSFTNRNEHGIVDGGHTYAAIREAVENATEQERENLKDAYVRLHIIQGINHDLVTEIAEGLNHSKQVDETSLINLQGEFDVIRTAMTGQTGEEMIAYHQGDTGQVYISEILVYLEMFNYARFKDDKHPNQLYKKQSLALKYFGEDTHNSPEILGGLINRLPEILKLSDRLRKNAKDAAKRVGIEYGRMKVGKERLASPKNKGIYLPFIDETIDFRVPNGWIYPMLAAFRANIRPTKHGEFEWKLPLDVLLNGVISDLITVVVKEAKENNQKPEMVGSRESSYTQCYDKVLLFLAKRGAL